MADITLTFSNEINISVQVGDMAYYCTPTVDGSGFNTSNQSSIIEIGPISSITGLVIICDMALTTVPPTANDFILFSKDNKVNASSLLGYYGLAKFKNDSTVKSEMFATACDVFESSK